MRKFKLLASRIRREEDGVTLVEYGIALTVAVGFGIAALTTLGSAIGVSINDASANMPAA